MSSSRTMNDDISQQSEFYIFRKLCSINPAKAQGPDGISGWLLKENADLLAPLIMDIVNASFREGRLPLSWKEADRPCPQTKTYPRHQQAPPPYLPYAYSFQDCRRLCCSWLCDTRRAILGQYLNHALRRHLLAWSITGTSALMGTRPWLEWFYMISVKRLILLITDNILVRKLSDYDILSHILCWIVDFFIG